MKELYIKKGNVSFEYSLISSSPKVYLKLATIDEIVNYFTKNPEGINSFKNRKNLNIILEVSSDTEREDLENALAKNVNFKLAYISYDLPYDKASEKHVLGEKNHSSPINH